MNKVKLGPVTTTRRWGMVGGAEEVQPWLLLLPLKNRRKRGIALELRQRIIVRRWVSRFRNPHRHRLINYCKSTSDSMHTRNQLHSVPLPVSASLLLRSSSPHPTIFSSVLLLPFMIQLFFEDELPFGGWCEFSISSWGSHNFSNHQIWRNWATRSLLWVSILWVGMDS